MFKLAQTLTMLPSRGTLIFVFVIFLNSCQFAHAQDDSLCTSPMARGGTVYIQDIPESWPNGTALTVLNVVGNDSEITLSATSSWDSHLSFDPVSRNLTLVQPLDHEKSQQIEVKLSCFIKENTFKVEIPIRVLILDVNDNPPVFLQARYSATINELSAVGLTVVGNIEATDADIDNWYITYALVDGPYSSYFDIPVPAKGIVTLKRPLNYELHRVMSITIMAQDNHPPVNTIQQPKLNSTTTLTVTVEDGDNQNPAFINAPYEGYVVENATLGKTVRVSPRVSAWDQDFGINASVRYDIVQDLKSGDSEHFRIDATTGIVSVKKVPIIGGRTYFLLLKATQVDSGQRYTMAALRVFVQSSNENPPRFAQSHVVTSVMENVPIGTTVTQVEAMDTDKFATLYYSFPNGESATDFTIDQKTGIITTAKRLDYETYPEYNITVEVTDTRYRDSMLLTVKVIDVNDNAPVFEQNTYIFEAKREVDYFVGKIKAADRDQGDTIRYDLVEQSEHFSLNAITGDIRISTGHPDVHLKQPLYYLFVVAKDNGNPQLEKSVVVRVQFEKGDFVEPSTGGGDDSVNWILVIILAVVCSVLFIIVIALTAYLLHQRTWKTNLPVSSTHHRYDDDDPEGLAYKSMPSRVPSHLTLYHHYGNEETDDGATSMQENPLAVDNPAFVYSPSDENDNTESHYMQPHEQDYAEQDRSLNEIEIATAVIPMNGTSPESTKKKLYINGSVTSFTSSTTNGTIPNSAQKIVMSSESLPNSSSSLGKRAAEKKKLSWSRKDQVKLFNAENSLDPNVSVIPSNQAALASGQADNEKPEITVYF